MNLGLSGYYQFETFRADADGNEIAGSRKVIKPWFPNLITNAGLNQLGSNTSDKLAYCMLGTGSTAPAETDTAMTSQVGSAVLNNSDLGTYGVNVPDGYVYRRTTYRFVAGTVAGVNLAEVGVASSGTAQLFSHALITDSGGNPTTITLSADEILDVVYELRAYITNADSTTTATINGVSTTITMRPHGFAAGDSVWVNMGENLGIHFRPRVSAGNSSEGVHTRTSQVSATSLPVAVSSQEAGYIASYVSDSHQMVAVLPVPLDQGNFTGGIGCVFGRGSGFGCWSYGFTPKVAKDATMIGEFRFGLQWGRRT